MGLISKTVIVKWNSVNKKWLESKGHIFTKMKDDFEVSVVDLTNGSNTLVNVKCDGINCENPYLKPMQWQYYLKYVHDDNTYYCNDCATKLFSGKKGRKTKLSKSKSFYQWCIENNKLYYLELWDYKLNKYKPDEISYGTNDKYYFKCPKGIHRSELKCIKIYTRGSNNSISCNKCNSFAQCGIDNLGENFLEKYWVSEENTIDPWEISSGNANIKDKVLIKCQNKKYHGNYKVTCFDFLNGARCPFCNIGNNGEPHILDSLGTLFPCTLNLWSNKNKKSPYDYTPNSGKEVWWKCSEGKHDDYYREINSSNNYDFRCPECTCERNESLLQEKVRLHIESFKYTVLHEHKCTIVPKNPKTKCNMPFDNELVELKLIIEVMGMQHYKISSWHKKQAKLKNTTPEYELHYQKLKDRYKRIFAKKQGYFYLEIPYWTDDKEETWKMLINEKIDNLKGVKK